MIVAQLQYKPNTESFLQYMADPWEILGNITVAVPQLNYANSEIDSDMITITNCDKLLVLRIF